MVLGNGIEAYDGNYVEVVYYQYVTNYVGLLLRFEKCIGVLTF